MKSRSNTRYLRTLGLAGLAGLLVLLFLSLFEYREVQSATIFEPRIRLELSSDSTNRPESVKAVINFRNQRDTFRLMALTLDSLLWDTTVINLDSAGVYGVQYLVYWTDGQITGENYKSTTLGSATLSPGDQAQIAARVADTLQTRGFPSAGIGNTRCSVFVRDTLYDVNVQGVDVYAYNPAGQRVTWNTTTAAGYARFNLDSTFTYTLTATEPGYVFPPSESFPVSTSSRVDTIKGYLFTPAAPPSASQANVWGWFYGVNGTGRSGILVEAKLSRNIATLVGSGVFVSKTTVTDTTDATGYWQLTLVKNDSILPVGTQYRFAATDSGNVLGSVTRSVTSSGLLDWTR